MSSPLAQRSRTLSVRTVRISKEQALLTKISKHLISSLKQGKLPWSKGFTSPAPFNPSSGTQFTGINFFLLHDAALRQGFSDPRWLTSKQAQLHGGYIAKGSLGTRIFAFERLPKLDSNQKPIPQLDAKQQPLMGTDGKPVYQQWCNLTSFEVFNVSQVKNLSLPPLQQQPTPPQQIERMSNLLNNSQAKLGIAPSFAFNPRTNEVLLPQRPVGAVDNNYDISTLYVLIAWSMHSKSLDMYNPDKGGSLAGADNLPKSALVQDLSLSILKGHFAIEPDNMLISPQLTVHVPSLTHSLQQDPSTLIDICAKAYSAAQLLKSFDSLKEREQTLLPSPDIARNHNAYSSGDISPERITDHNASLVKSQVQATLDKSLDQALSVQPEPIQEPEPGGAHLNRRNEHRPRERTISR